MALRAKSLTVLWYLLERAGQVVTKEELLQAVWPGLAVSEGVLTVCISELRRVLGDEAQAPQYIETVHRRGYRFIGALQGPASRPPAGSPPEALPPSQMVGRTAELHQLQDWFAQVQRGQRRVVFVSGEAGIGKTTLVEAFLAHMAATEGVWLARGECVEHYGAGEAYLPVLAALGRLCRGPGGAHLLALLSQ
jgi:DNA-binding winged helix-turn-helix (wHTH) protein